MVCMASRPRRTTLWMVCMASQPRRTTLSEWSALRQNPEEQHSEWYAWRHNPEEQHSEWSALFAHSFHLRSDPYHGTVLNKILDLLLYYLAVL
jgi:hypothetical protein